MALFYLKPRRLSQAELDQWRLRAAAHERQLRQELLAVLESRAQRPTLDPAEATREIEAWLEARRVRPREAWELIREDRDSR